MSTDHENERKKLAPNRNEDETPIVRIELLEDQTPQNTTFEEAVEIITENVAKKMTEEMLKYRNVIEPYISATEIHKGVSSQLKKNLVLFNLGLRKNLTFPKDPMKEVIGLKSSYHSARLRSFVDDYLKVSGMLVSGAIDEEPPKTNETSSVETSLKREEQNAEAFTIDAAINKGAALARKGNNAEAIEMFDKALNIDQNSLEALNNKATSLMALGDYAGSIELFDRALGMKADYIPALSNKATALSKLGRNDEALTTIEKAIDVYKRSGRTPRVSLELSGTSIPLGA